MEFLFKCSVCVCATLRDMTKRGSLKYINIHWYFIEQNKLVLFSNHLTRKGKCFFNCCILWDIPFCVPQRPTATQLTSHKLLNRYV